jgi:hypothetical protein
MPMVPVNSVVGDFKDPVSFIEGPDGAQINLLPSSIEDYIAPEALVRVVDAFEAFGFDEGERSLQYWRDAHTRYFSRLGRYKPDMMLWCERFELIERTG